MLPSTKAARVQKLEQIVQERLDRGLTVQQFCAEKGYSEGGYYHWVTIIHKEDPSFKTSTFYVPKIARTGEFVEVAMQPSSSSQSNHMEEQSPAAEIRAGTVTVSLFNNAAAPFMRQLFEVIQNA